jgi:Zn-dependent protease
MTPSLFDLLSLFYAFLGVRALWTLAKNWRAFTDAELTAFDRRLATEIAFFVFIPIGVFLHELGHAAATYQVGGTIDWFGGGFHYALFYGYVIPEGRFTALQDWWISLAGNLVSVVYGFLPLIF